MKKIPLFLFLITLVIYIHNLSPSVYGGDSGDFIAAALTRGVPHPSGYPLYTMLGIIFVNLPLAATPAWKFGLLSAILSAATIAIFYLMLFELTKKTYHSIIASLILAFTYPFWLHAEIVEVFALHSLFIVLLLFFTIKYINSKNKKFLYLLSFTTGLSLTNNLSILLLFPPVALALLFAKIKTFLNIKIVLYSLFFFFLGLLPYLYIPIAARNYPEINWGYAINFENFWALVSRQYYGWGTKAISERLDLGIINYRFKTYLDYWLTYANPVVIPLIICGMIYTIFKKKFLVFFLIFFSFILLGPFFVIYSGKYIKNFLNIASFEKFLVSNFITSYIFIPFTIIASQELILILPVRKFFQKILNTLVIIVFLVIPLMSFVANFERLNLRNNFAGDNLAKNILSTLPERSVLLLRNDNLAFNTIYYQIAFNFRRDVIIPGPTNGFRAALEALGMANEEVNSYIIRNKGIIDSKRTFDKSIIELMKKNNVFIDGIYNIEDENYGKISTVPFGLVYKLEFQKNLPYQKQDYLDTVDMITSSYVLEDFKNDKIFLYSLIYADIKKVYSVGFYNIADYLRLQYDYDKNVLKYLLKSIEIDPFTPSV